MIGSLLSLLYSGVVVGIAAFGMLGLVTIWFYRKHKDDSFPLPEYSEAELPPVTVQLPIYNERLVVNRLIESAINLDYPNHLLQIQILDDSDDETTKLAMSLVEKYRADGFTIEVIHRDCRVGFKAGALQEGLKRSTGEFIAVFDADFAPGPGFLLSTVPHFLTDCDLGMIQTRWSHLNPGDSALTAAQSIALDKHFVMEQSVRHRADLFPKFNGSAGIWRRACLVQAGGWEEDTVCEDLCLSTRALLQGWRFLYLNGVTAPAELPVTISAYKNQQARWAKGSTQCLLKYGGRIITTRNYPLISRLYALLSMAGYSTHLLLIALLFLQLPLMFLGYQPPAFLFLFGILSLAQPLLFIYGQRVLYGDWIQRLRYLPALLIVAIGIAPSNSRAMIEAILGSRNQFVRTPKGNPSPQPGNGQGSLSGYSLPIDWIILVELSLMSYAIFGIALSITRGSLWPVIFMSTCALGFGYVALSSILEQITYSRRSTLRTSASTGSSVIR